MRTVENIKIGISGIRGILGDTLNPEIALNFTRAFATLIRKGRVAVAKDSRISGDLIKRAVFSGLSFSQITPVDTFTIPTPTLQIYVKEKNLNGGIIVTASHNPEEWNGLKFVNNKGLFLLPFTATYLLDIYHERSFIRPDNNRFPKTEIASDAFKIHQRKVLSQIDCEKIRKGKFRVLIDAGGGAGSLYDREFLESLGCNVEMINHKVGTYFPRNPEPTPANLARASEMMQSGDYDIGFAQDSDADRLAILDETGTPVESDYTLALALAHYTRKKRSGIAVFNQSTSKVVEFVCKKNGFQIIHSPVGEINVVEKMLQVDAEIGGEGNGGLIVPDVHHCRDSFTAMGMVLETLAGSGQTVSDIIRTFPKYRIIKRKINSTLTESYRILSALKEEYQRGNTMDGLRVDQKDHWFHIRPSNTEPILRIIAEGKVDEIETIVDQLLKKIDKMR